MIRVTSLCHVQVSALLSAAQSRCHTFISQTISALAMVAATRETVAAAPAWARLDACVEDAVTRFGALEEAYAHGLATAARAADSAVASLLLGRLHALVAKTAKPVTEAPPPAPAASGGEGGGGAEKKGKKHGGGGGNSSAKAGTDKAGGEKGSGVAATSAASSSGGGVPVASAAAAVAAAGSSHPSSPSGPSSSSTTPASPAAPTQPIGGGVASAAQAMSRLSLGVGGMAKSGPPPGIVPRLTPEEAAVDRDIRLATALSQVRVGLTDG